MREAYGNQFRLKVRVIHVAWRQKRYCEGDKNVFIRFVEGFWIVTEEKGQCGFVWTVCSDDLLC